MYERDCSALASSVSFEGIVVVTTWITSSVENKGGNFSDLKAVWQRSW